MGLSMNFQHRNDRFNAATAIRGPKIGYKAPRFAASECALDCAKRMGSWTAALGLAVFLLVFWSPLQAGAQSLGGSGTTWGGSWQFQSTAARSINVQQADVIKRAESGFYNSFGPDQTTVNNTTINDSRSNYVEANSAEGSRVEITNRTGDDIGKVSNVTGAINTGSTDIKVDGSSNTVHAINSSESQGCLDGSINEAQLRNHYLDSASAASVLNTVAGLGGPDTVRSNASSGGTQSNCVTR